MKVSTLALGFNRSLVNYQIKDLTWTVSLALLAIITPALLAHTPNNQLITGSLVNAILFIAVYRVGLVNAMLIAIIPSSIALMRGLLPAPLATLIPYIIISNIILATSFWLLKRTPRLGVIIASITKFAFLYAISLFFASKITSPLLIMLSWPQLFTALVGGIIALTFIKLSNI